MAGFIEWDEKLSVGIKEIDDQHKKLVGIINTLYEAMRNGQANTVLKDSLNELVKYTIYHFSTEENLMNINKYPESLIQINAHKDFTVKISELQIKLNEGAVFLSVNTFTFLREWLTKHIMETDKKLGKFLKENGYN